MVRALIFLLAAATALIAAPPAGAELVGEFNARLKQIRTWGGYTAVLDSRVYETDGSPPPTLASAQVRFPRGVELRKRFLRPRFFCDPTLLEADPDPALCRRAHFGSGRIILDGRPWIEGALPADLELFLGRPSKPGAIATAVVLVLSNDMSPAYDFQVLRGHLLRDSGRFGYRLELPTAIRPRLPGLDLRLAELSLTVRGLRARERRTVCVRRAAGRCRARRTTSRLVFWTRPPRCGRSRRLLFGAEYAFQGVERISKRRRIKCRRFLRRPVKRRGSIPGAP